MAGGAGEGAPGEQGGAAARVPRLAPLYKRLPSGPHRLGKRAVARHQRVRIHGAMVQAVAGVGYDDVSVKQVIALAGVSRRSFYEQFASKQECFLATFDVIARQQLAAARLACARMSGPPERRLAASLDSCADSVTGDREAAAFVLLDALTLGAPAAPRIRALAGAWERLLEASLASTALAPTPAGPTAAGLVGGLHGIMAARLRDPSPPARPTVAEQLRWWALTPKVPRRVREARRLSGLLRDGARRSASVTVAEPSRSPPGGDRERLLASALSLAARSPVQVLSAVQIADGAGVPVDAFFELFAGRDECLQAALADAGEQLLAIAGFAAACAAAEDWPGALRESLARLLSHLAAHPLQARAVTALAPCAGADCRRYGLELERELGRALTAGAPAACRELAGDALVGALWHLVRCHLADRRIRRLAAAADHVTLLVLAPVLGADGAAAALLDGC